MMADSADKYQLLDSLPMAPGHCWLTKAIEGPFLDTGMEVKFSEVGRIYVAVEAVREMAQAAGLFEGLQPVDADRENLLLSQGYTEGVNARGAFDLAVEQLGVLADRLHGHPVVEANAAAPEEPAITVTDGPDRPAQGAGADASEPEPDSTGGQGDGPRRNRRSAGVSAGTSDGNPFRI